MTPFMTPTKWSLLPKSVVSVMIGRAKVLLAGKTKCSQNVESNRWEPESQGTEVIRKGNIYHGGTEPRRNSLLFSVARCLRGGFGLLLNVYIARSRTQSQQRPAAAHFADNLLARLLHPALHRHRDRRIYVQRARTGGNICVEGGIRRQPHVHV